MGRGMVMVCHDMGPDMHTVVMICHDVGPDMVMGRVILHQLVHTLVIWRINYSSFGASFGDGSYYSSSFGHHYKHDIYMCLWSSGDI